MESAVGAASWLLGKAITKLSDELVAAFVASSELGHNFHDIKLRLKYTLGLVEAAQGKDMSNNPSSGLQSLLADLSRKADEAEDVLDEIHYFLIQDQLDGTTEAAVQEPATPHVDDVVRAHARDGRHAVRHTVGNCLQCFYFCSPTKDDDSAAVNISTKPYNTAMSSSSDDSRPIDKLPFNRVAMSHKIKTIVEEMNSICEPVSNLLNIANQSRTETSTAVTLNRPTTGSIMVQDKLFGRSVIFEQTVIALTGGTDNTLSVLPFVGPGGVGKTTFTQHLYNDRRIDVHFVVKVWVCVSTEFDVLKLTRQILSCIPTTEKEEKYKCTVETANLDQLQKSVAERLRSKRFLVVLDDFWKCSSETDWNSLLAPFKQGETKGSMFLVTTRFPSIALLVKTSNLVELHGLEPNEFFEFFQTCIFGHSKPEHCEDGLIDVAKNKAKKLKGSPLAANTVGRLLKKDISEEYWTRVLERNEWQHTKNDDDIMPSLKISYDYLPFLLKKCFSYCALFPEDYRFYNLEITTFWTAIGILDSNCRNDKNYLEQLMENGFLMKAIDSSGSQYYVMHDLLHELCQNISSQECTNISSSSFSAETIPQSIRHLSITIGNKYDESFVEEMGTLKGRIDVGNLRTLMVFGYPDAEMSNVYKTTFEDIKSLRVLFLPMSTPESLPTNFSNLIHLQYLQIRSGYDIEEMNLPSSLSRFYHLRFLDLEYWHGRKKLPKDINRLVNLCHFHSSKELHSSIPNVGKMKFLQELKEFNVKKETVGFELRELGELTELGGELSICNLETVGSKEEASDAKLRNKKNLKELILVWGREHRTICDDVLEGLQPHHSLRGLHIINAGVAPCPSWLRGDISTKMLECLYIEGVSWGTLPSFGQLPRLTELILKNVAGVRRLFEPDFGGATERGYMHLKKIVVEDMPELEEWAGEPNSHLFSRLESIKLRDCPLLCSFPFLECSDHFINLSKLDIVDCPKLSQFPPMPHTSTLTDIRVQKDNIIQLLYRGKELTVDGYNSALIFHNMHAVEVMKIVQNSMRCLELSIEMADGVALPSVQNLGIEELCISGELFSEVLKCFPALSQLTIRECKSLELLPVEDGGLSGLKTLQLFTGKYCGKLFSRWPKGEVGGGGHAIKPFPTSLRELEIFLEPSMQSVGLLSNLTSLTSLRLVCCRELTIDGFNPPITANLKKFTKNAMYSEQEDTSIAGDLLSEIARSKLMHAGSFQLEELWVDSISAVLTAPVCSHLAASLHTLKFSFDQRATFTEEQEQALQLLTSLKYLQFDFCNNLQSLPQGLRGLSCLKRLTISMCEKMQCLPPKEGFPASLETLLVYGCGPELSEQARKLKESDPWFSVQGTWAINY